MPCATRYRARCRRRSSTRRGMPRRTGRRSALCCFLPPARVSTSSEISRFGAMRSGPWWGNSKASSRSEERMVSRVERGLVANWWWTIDRWFLSAFLALMVLGIVLSFAASPAVAERIGLEPYHFVTRQRFFMVPALIIMIAVSFLDPRNIRRLSVLILVGSLVMMVATLYVGMEVKGSRRWIYLAGLSVQPSEYLKPAFVVMCAWLFAENKRQPDIPGNLFAMILLGLVLALLVAQPDLGQTLLVLGTWGVMFFLAGLPWIWIGALAGLGSLGALMAYSAFPHVAGRVDRFLTGEGDTYQVDMGREAMIRGGWFGQGPGEGTIKRILPDSHTD